MEKIGDIFPFLLITAVIAFIFGIALGDSYGYKQGFKEGFDRALPLTYASVVKYNK